MIDAINCQWCSCFFLCFCGCGCPFFFSSSWGISNYTRSIRIITLNANAAFAFISIRRRVPAAKLNYIDARAPTRINAPSIHLLFLSLRFRFSVRSCPQHFGLLLGVCRGAILRLTTRARPHSETAAFVVNALTKTPSRAKYDQHTQTHTKKRRDAINC